MADPFAPARPPITLPPAEAIEGRAPRVLAHVLRYLPSHNAGAERMLHELLAGLVARGWDATVVAVEHRGDPYEWDGILVQALTDAQMVDPYSWCDIAVTHLDVTPMALAWARYGRPLVHLVHNHRQLLHHRVPNDGAQAVIWNSEWVVDAAEAEVGGPWRGPSIVVRPPSFAADHAISVKDRRQLRTATLVNLLGEKGGPLFWRLARKADGWAFLGVKGAYGMQVVPDPLPPNGTVVENRPDLADVWASTSVYLAPSWYESWGLAPVEAMHSGIPVVAHPTPGLVEALTSPTLGPCAIFVDRDDDDAWVDALHRLRNVQTWRKWSKLSYARSAELDEQATGDLDRLDAWARDLAGFPSRAATGV